MSVNSLYSVTTMTIEHRFEKKYIKHHMVFHDQRLLRKHHTSIDTNLNKKKLWNINYVNI